MLIIKKSTFKKGAFFAVSLILLFIVALAGCSAAIGGGDSEDNSAIGSGGGTVDPNLPAAPSALTGDHIAIFDVFIEWADNSNNEDGFNIYRIRVDTLSLPVLAGITGKDEVAFQDENTLCGARYRYIAASFNESGESPVTACWEIQLPTCPITKEIDYGLGVESGFNFLTGQQSATNDVYLAIGSGGAAQLMADQAGQGGLADIGPTGQIPLERITLPDNIDYIQDGVPPVEGNTYVLKTSDPSILAIFKLNSLGNSINLTYILWRDSPPDSGACTGGFGFGVGGGVCISGDGVCDPNCTPAESERVGQNADEGDVSILCDDPTYIDIALEASGKCNKVALQETDVDEYRRVYLACLSAAMSQARPAHEAYCRAQGPLPNGILDERDEDCSESECVPDDGICNATCGGQTTNTPTCPASEEVLSYGEGQSSCCKVIDGVVDTSTCYPISDNDCKPGDDPGGNSGGSPGTTPGECVDDGVCTPGEQAKGSCRDCSTNPGDSCGVPCTGSCGGGLDCVGGVCWSDAVCKTGGGDDPGDGNNGGSGDGNTCACECSNAGTSGELSICTDSCTGNTCTP